VPPYLTRSHETCKIGSQCYVQFKIQASDLKFRRQRDTKYFVRYLTIIFNCRGHTSSNKDEKMIMNSKQIKL
jgi:hypothetical protein